MSTKANFTNNVDLVEAATTTKSFLTANRMPLTPHDKTSPACDGNKNTRADTALTIHKRPQRAKVHEAPLKSPAVVRPFPADVCHFQDAWTPPHTPVKKNDEAVMQSSEQHGDAPERKIQSSRRQCRTDCNARPCCCSRAQQGHGVSGSWSTSTWRSDRRSAEESQAATGHNGLRNVNMKSKSNHAPCSDTAAIFEETATSISDAVHDKKHGSAARSTKKKGTNDRCTASDKYERSVCAPVKKALTGRAAICAGRQSSAFDTLAIAVQDDITAALVDTMRTFRRKLDIFAKRANKDAQRVIYTHSDVDAAVLKAFDAGEKAARSGKLLQVASDTTAVAKKHSNIVKLRVKDRKDSLVGKKAQSGQTHGKKTSALEDPPVPMSAATVPGQQEDIPDVRCTVGLTRRVESPSPQVGLDWQPQKEDKKLRHTSNMHADRHGSIALPTRNSPPSTTATGFRTREAPDLADRSLLGSHSKHHQRDCNSVSPASVSAWATDGAHVPTEFQGDLGSEQPTSIARAAVPLWTTHDSPRAESPSAVHAVVTKAPPSSKHSASPNTPRKRRHHWSNDRSRATGTGAVGARSRSKSHANGLGVRGCGKNLMSPLTHLKHSDGSRKSRSRSGTPLLASSPFLDEEETERLRVPTPEVMLAGVNDVLTAVNGAAFGDDDVVADPAKPAARSSLGTTSFSYVGAAPPQPSAIVTTSIATAAVLCKNGGSTFPPAEHSKHIMDFADIRDNQHVRVKTFSNTSHGVEPVSSMAAARSWSNESEARIGYANPQPRRPSMNSSREKGGLCGTGREVDTRESNRVRACSNDDDDDDDNVFEDMMLYKKRKLAHTTSGL
eukprot:m.963717 g.963717  ORF g.963717 m.963717 type:complete len:839 (+) comp23898_c0_seq3:335-2851(+)